MIRYFDTSAVARILIDEPGSLALRALLHRWTSDTLLSSQLMATELHRLAGRVAIAPQIIHAAIGAFELVDVEREDFVQARTLGPALARTLDVVHVAVAVRVGAQCVATYDTGQIEVARTVGLAVVSPT